MDYTGGGERVEWPLDRKFAAIKASGFEGYQWFALPDVVKQGADHGLAYLGCCQANSANYTEQLAAFSDLNPRRVSVQLGDHTTLPDESARVWLAMLKQAEDLNLAIDLETHRGTCTETPEKTWLIADLVAQKTGRLINLNFDFSHFAVVRHLTPPYTERLIERLDLLHASRQIHMRPFNGHHCEIPMTDGNDRLTDWAHHWLRFASDVLSIWHKANPNEYLWVCPEFGAVSSGYWISPFCDPWLDAQRCRHELSQVLITRHSD